MSQEERKRVIWAKKKEKEDIKRERERIRKELQADKLERQANKGKLKSQLGVDGYNPSAIQYDDGKGEGEVEKMSAIPKKMKTVDNRSKEQRVRENLARVASHRAGGDGLNCLNLLDVFFKNIVEKPGEVRACESRRLATITVLGIDYTRRFAPPRSPAVFNVNNTTYVNSLRSLQEKFRRINTQGKAYKSKVKGVVGGRKALLDCGFKDDGEERLVFGEDGDVDFLTVVRGIIKEEVAKLS